jgi:hypothetical protein
MNKKLILLIALAIALIAGCKKTDNASNWVGTYTSVNPTDSINQVTIAEVNSSTLQIQLQAHYGTIVYTYATIQQAKLQSATTVLVNETGNVAGYTGTFQFSGSGVLSGNSLTISGGAVNTADTLGYYFSGAK